MRCMHKLRNDAFVSRCQGVIRQHRGLRARIAPHSNTIPSMFTDPVLNGDAYDICTQSNTSILPPARFKFNSKNYRDVQA